MPWGISENASKKEKIKADFNDHINGLNSCGEISYNTYSTLFDIAENLFEEMYECGKESVINKDFLSDNTKAEE